MISDHHSIERRHPFGTDSYPIGVNGVVSFSSINLGSVPKGFELPIEPILCGDLISEIPAMSSHVSMACPNVFLI